MTRRALLVCNFLIFTFLLCNSLVAGEWVYAPYTTPGFWTYSNGATNDGWLYGYRWRTDSYGHGYWHWGQIVQLPAGYSATTTTSAAGLTPYTPGWRAAMLAIKAQQLENEAFNSDAKLFGLDVRPASAVNGAVVNGGAYLPIAKQGETVYGSSSTAYGTANYQTSPAVDLNVLLAAVSRGQDQTSQAWQLAMQGVQTLTAQALDANGEKTRWQAKAEFFERAFNAMAKDVPAVTTNINTTTTTTAPFAPQAQPQSPIQQPMQQLVPQQSVPPIPTPEKPPVDNAAAVNATTTAITGAVGVLKTSCLKCHGGDPAKIDGGLNLMTLGALDKAGLAEKRDKILVRVTSTDPTKHMPKNSDGTPGRQLSAVEVQTIKDGLEALAGK